MKAINLRASNNDRSHSVDIKIRPRSGDGSLVAQENEAYAEVEVLFHALRSHLSHATWEILKAKIVEEFLRHKVENLTLRRKPPNAESTGWFGAIGEAADDAAERLQTLLAAHNRLIKKIEVGQVFEDKGVPMLTVRCNMEDHVMTPVGLFIERFCRVGWEGFRVRVEAPIPLKPRKGAK